MGRKRCSTLLPAVANCVQSLACPVTAATVSKRVSSDTSGLPKSMTQAAKHSTLSPTCVSQTCVLTGTSSGTASWSRGIPHHQVHLEKWRAQRNLWAHQPQVCLCDLLQRWTKAKPGSMLWRNALLVESSSTPCCALPLARSLWRKRVTTCPPCWTLWNKLLNCFSIWFFIFIISSSEARHYGASLVFAKCVAYEYDIINKQCARATKGKRLFQWVNHEWQRNIHKSCCILMLHNAHWIKLFRVCRFKLHRSVCLDVRLLAQDICKFLLLG